ncbi:unnamed protein product [Caenorhabditis nigoni]
MRFEEFQEAETPDFQLNVSGKNIDFRLFTENFHIYPVACVQKSDNESILESVHNYFLDFFGTSVDYYWKAKEFQDGPYYIPKQLQSVSFCISMYLGPRFTNIENLENFFSSSPVLKSVQMCFSSSHSKTSFNPESKFYQAEFIDIDQRDNSFPDILSHFQGKQVFMRCKRCEIPTLIGFLKKWKSGEAFRKLEHLMITVSWQKFDQIMIQNIIGVKYIDAKKQPPTHTLPRDAYIPSHPNGDILMRLEEFKETERPDFQLNVSGKIIDFRLFTRERNKEFWLPETGFHPYPVACVQKSGKESILESVHNYFLDFFGNSVKYYWKADFFEEVHYYVPAQLRNLSFCMSTYVDSDFTNMENLENFFSSSPVLKSVQLFTSNSEISFNPESKFYQAESIETRQVTNTFPDILSHFQGKQAFMICKKCEITALIGFVKIWKSGEAFGKLEYLKVTVIFHNLNGIIHNIIGVKYIDAKKQPPTHTSPKIFDWDDVVGDTVPIISHSYVVRESDNRVASILIQENKLSFGVWDKTEEEFLRMVNEHAS